MKHGTKMPLGKDWHECSSPGAKAKDMAPEGNTASVANVQKGREPKNYGK